MTNETNPILDRMIDTFDAYATNLDPSTPIALRDMITDTTLTITRADYFDDIAIAHFDLDDELHELTLIAIFDRDTLTMRTLTLHSDCTISPIPLPDSY